MPSGTLPTSPRGCWRSSHRQASSNTSPTSGRSWPPPAPPMPVDWRTWPPGTGSTSISPRFPGWPPRTGSACPDEGGPDEGGPAALTSPGCLVGAEDRFRERRPPGVAGDDAQADARARRCREAGTELAGTGPGEIGGLPGLAAVVGHQGDGGADPGRGRLLQVRHGDAERLRAGARGARQAEAGELIAQRHQVLDGAVPVEADVVVDDRRAAEPQ